MIVQRSWQVTGSKGRLGVMHVQVSILGTIVLILPYVVPSDLFDSA